MDELVAQIATASQEQSQGIGQITTAVHQMDKVTQSNAESSEESAASAEELSSQATSLKKMVESLEILVGQTNGVGVKRPSVPSIIETRSVPAFGQAQMIKPRAARALAEPRQMREEKTKCMA